MTTTMPSSSNGTQAIRRQWVRRRSRRLTWLAVEQRLSASTQNQAFCAVLFLYRDVLQMEVGAIMQMPRPRMPTRLPVVLSREEISRVQRLPGTIDDDLHARAQSRSVRGAESGRPAVTAAPGVSQASAACKQVGHRSFCSPAILALATVTADVCADRVSG